MKGINKHIIKQAIIDYRNDGKQLMEKLGKKYDLNIQIEDEYQQLISRNNIQIPRQGELSKKWNYGFHGGECGFYNKKHQQSIEVVLSNSPEFGHLDAWFLMKYMKSTPKYKDKVKKIKWLDLKPIINELYELDEIENITR